MDETNENWGWILVPKDLVTNNDFWEEMKGVFYPTPLSFTIDGISHILGQSDRFEEWYGVAEEAPSYDIIYCVDTNEFYDFQLSDMKL